MSFKNKILSLSLATLLVGAAGAAHAAGFQLREQGAAGQGTSYAGATAGAQGLEMLFYNPAAMMLLDSKYAISGGASMIDPKAQLRTGNVTTGAGGQPNATNSNGGDAGKPAVVPHLYAMGEIAPNWRAGVSVTTPFGLSTEYQQNWVGRYYAIDSELQTLNITPTLATKVAKNVSVAGGIQIQQASARLTTGVNQGALGAGTPDGQVKVVGDDIGYGYVGSVLWQPQDATRVGVTYRSRIHQKLDGDLTTNRLTGGFASSASLREAEASAKVTTPDMLSLGVSHQLTDRWTVLGELSWTNWSLFKHLRVIEDGTGVVRQNVSEDWHDTYFASVGGEYKMNDKLKLRTGVAYDKGAVDTNHRTFRIPDSDRLWTSVGAGYSISEKLGVDVGYTHIFARAVSVTEDTAASGPTNAGRVTGKYSPNVNILSASMTYKF